MTNEEFLEAVSTAMEADSPFDALDDLGLDGEIIFEAMVEKWGGLGPQACGYLATGVVIGMAVQAGRDE